MMDGFVDLTALMQPCVYMLMHQNVVVYIGQSRKPLSRLYTHMNATTTRKGAARLAYLNKYRFKFDGIMVRSCSLEEMSELERSLIDKYAPRHNVLHKGASKAKRPFELSVNGVTLTLNKPEAPSAPLPLPPHAGFVRRVLAIVPLPIPEPTPTISPWQRPPKPPQPYGRSYFDGALERRV